MLNDFTDTLIREALEQAGFDFDSPDPRTAWQAFKAFAATPVPAARTITIGYFAAHASDRDQTLLLFFGRRFEDDSGMGWSSGCLLSTTVPPSLVGADDENWWWPEHLTREEWFLEVEANPTFVECLAVPRWQWEGFSE